MNSLVYLHKMCSNNSEIELFDVGKIVEFVDDGVLVDFLRINKTIVVGIDSIEEILIEETGDRHEHKICDRCFKHLKTDLHFENNRLKKGDVITKRPSCRECRKIKNGINVPDKVKKEWSKKKPKIGEIFLCPICKKQSIGGVSKHVLDHNHKTGEVRGYICESCNTGIGRFDDDIELVYNAINWLKYQKT
jgi:hypothetical protein